MALGIRDEKNVADNAEELEDAATELGKTEDEFNAFFYLRDLLTSLDMALMTLDLVHQQLSRQDLPDDIRRALTFLPETEFVRLSSADLSEKIKKISPAVEGALQASAAIDLAHRASSILRGDFEG